MSDQAAIVDKSKKERSPSFPFISLRKAEERARTFWEKHRRDGARLAVIAPTWGYQPRSSGLQQTVAALKQYGLLDDVGSGDDRKLSLSDLGRRLLADQRPGAKGAALKEAALRPRLFQEYQHWAVDAPSEAHRMSDLELDRGFNPEAAKAFIRAFDSTVSYAGLANQDILSSTHDDPNEEDMPPQVNPVRSEPAEPSFPDGVKLDILGSGGPLRLPFSARCKVEITPGSLRISATLFSQEEVEKLAQVLDANKVLLDQESKDA
jgi:hypothetical protein